MSYCNSIRSPSRNWVSVRRSRRVPLRSNQAALLVHCVLDGGLGQPGVLRQKIHGNLRILGAYRLFQAEALRRVSRVENSRWARVVPLMPKCRRLQLARDECLNEPGPDSVACLVIRPADATLLEQAETTSQLCQAHCLKLKPARCLMQGGSRTLCYAATLLGYVV